MYYLIEREMKDCTGDIFILNNETVTDLIEAESIANRHWEHLTETERKKVKISISGWNDFDPLDERYENDLAWLPDPDYYVCKEGE